jgi:hypothetical protein
VVKNSKNSLQHLTGHFSFLLDERIAKIQKYAQNLNISMAF